MDHKPRDLEERLKESVMFHKFRRLGDKFSPEGRRQGLFSLRIAEELRQALIKLGLSK